MWLAVVDRIEVDQWQLSKFLSPYFKDGLRLSPLVPAPVQQDVGLVVQGSELLLVVSLELDSVVVVTSPGVEPGGGVDAGVGEVLVGLLTEQSQEGQLDWTERIVADAEASSESGVPALSALPPGDVGHPAGVHVRRDTGLSSCRHVAVHLHSVVHHPQVGIDPVETWQWNIISMQ